MAELDTGVSAAKQAVREHVWETLEQERVALFPGARRRIPNFVAAEQAAAKLAAQPEWAAATVVKANPDSPQLPVRSRVLASGKYLYMAVPKLAGAHPFVLVDPAVLTISPRRAASKDWALSVGEPVAVGGMRPVDLVVCGSVAVNRLGVRVGKGGGYADIEVALLVDAGLVDERTTIVTTVHESQVFDEPLPETGHDFRVDVIVTPDQVIRVPGSKSRPGLMWDQLSEEKIASIPVLAAMRSEQPE
ncbi:5-formyltetrahydrofolate cyclo-ligase [Saccharomonospora sp. NPDC006951]